jgi:hypothetical protein
MWMIMMHDVENKLCAVLMYCWNRVSVRRVMCNAQRAVIGGLTETGLVAAGDGEQQATIANQQASSAMAANCKLIVIVIVLAIKIKAVH